MNNTMKRREWTDELGMWEYKLTQITDTIDASYFNNEHQDPEMFEEVGNRLEIMQYADGIMLADFSNVRDLEHAEQLVNQFVEKLNANE